MNRHTIRRFITSSSFRLASTYLAIIMLMSIGFSFVFYNVSSHELGRQIPPDAYTRNLQLNPNGDNDDGGQQPVQTRQKIDAFFQQRAHEGRDELLTRLIILNVVALLAGSVLSYILARRSLRPIERVMDAQVQFVSDASHELRTPLTVIQAGNDVALRDKHLSLKQAREVIANNTEEAIKLKELSDGLLNLAKQDTTTLKLEPLAIQEIAASAINRVIPAAQLKDISIDDQLAPFVVKAHDQALVEVLYILLDNAIKYSHVGGVISVDARKKGRHVFVGVHDSGVGIRASDMPHIFRRFYRADAARTGNNANDGYGLGLSIAQKLVEQQQGAITVESEPGKGATFTIRLLQAASNAK